jgi:hypothetical protein
MRNEKVGVSKELSPCLVRNATAGIEVVVIGMTSSRARFLSTKKQIASYHRRTLVFLVPSWKSALRRT